MQPEEIEVLLEKYANGTANAEERALVETWYLNHEPSVSSVPDNQMEDDRKQSLEILLSEIIDRPKHKFWLPLTVAASLLVLFSAIGFYYLISSKPKEGVNAIHESHKADLLPGGNKATITLANGSQIVLTGTKNGIIAKQGSTQINKTGEGVISYENTDHARPAAKTVYNIAATPRGGQFQFVLSDGTKVWLNASSSIKFPVAFAGNERKVELSGEAYFEVVHDAARPFRVVSNGQVVEDLGTHFNINAYSDENALKTTLLEGSIRVVSGGESRVLKPGEQVQLKNGNMKILSVDVEEVIAWKNGLFHFDNSSIQEVARQLSRWYDVDIKYEGQLPPRRFFGEISRNVNASQILDILTFKKIHYRIEGKSILILP